MTTPLMKRIGHWLGTWRGPIDIPGTEHGLLELEIAPVFGGESVELRSLVLDSDSGRDLTHGYGLYAMGPGGRVDLVLFSKMLGFCRMQGVEDDPDVYSFEGKLSGNLTLHVSIQVEEDELMIVHRVREGYIAGNVPAETASRLRRLGGEAPVE